MGMISNREGRASQRFSSKALLVVTILPLWALWIYALVTLQSLEREVEALPRFYGMYLYKEHIRARLEEASRLVGLLENDRVQGIGGETTEVFTEEGRETLDLLFGPEEALVVVERKGLRILHPSAPSYGTADFLGDPEARSAFLRTLERMEANRSRGGYFSIDASDVSGESKRRRWFLTLAPAGEALLCVLPVPEERVNRSGGTLEEAQEDLLQEKRRQFVLLTLPVVVLSTLFIGVLCRRQGRSNRGRGQ
jgi:hypothetical protein